MTNIILHRRHLLASALAGASATLLGGLAAPALAQIRPKVVTTFTIIADMARPAPLPPEPERSEEEVAAIIADVKARGDVAVAELTAKFDGFDLDAVGWEIPVAELDAARRAVVHQHGAGFGQVLDDPRAEHLSRARNQRPGLAAAG